ncbi:MAG: Na/Pi cotransporter family protein [Gammaproteobacteria bacterium]|nr:Na/Pi cotransporter family protein [Gammaproteobacteria bacterium]
MIGVFCGAIFAPALAAAASSSANEMHWWDMGMKLCGGLALFLFGMEQMSDSLKAVAGDRMKTILATLTKNRFTGAITGAFVTAIIQSSSVTTVLVVGFITAGLMSMSQSIGVIMGANIGTTITAQIVAFKVTKAALLMVAVGFGMMFLSHREKIKQYGAMLMGLGLVFFGMSVMSDAMKPLRTYQPFLDLMVQMEAPVIGILIAAGFTALIQSSSATTGIVIVMASQGFISLPAGIALAFGANVGTCVTALLASIGKPREALRAAAVHVLFNILGVLVWLGFITHLANFVSWFSPSHPELMGADRLAAETPRQIANAHTIFNIANTFIFIGFAGQFARFVEWLVPDKPIEEVIIAEPKYLDDELLETPSLALGRVRLEIGHVGGLVKDMLEDIMPAILSGNHSVLEEIAEMDDKVDALHGQIVTYLGKISQKSLSETQTHELLGLMDAVNDLENIGDIIETDLVYLGNQRIEAGLTIGDQTRELLASMHEIAITSTQLATDAVMTEDEVAARKVIAMKEDLHRLTDWAAIHQADRLVVDEPNRLSCYTIEVDIIEKLKRIYYFSKRMSKTVIADTLIEEQKEQKEQVLEQ